MILVQARCGTSEWGNGVRLLGDELAADSSKHFAVIIQSLQDLKQNTSTQSGQYKLNNKESSTLFLFLAPPKTPAQNRGTQNHGNICGEL